MSGWKFILLFCGLIFSWVATAKTEVVNVYNWANYIPKDVIDRFEKETGIKVNYSTYDNNELLYTKIKANPRAGYDIVVPSSFIVERMRKNNLLLKLDKSKIPNLVNINPSLLNQSFDPGNRYSVPYLWGTTGILINSNYYADGDIQSWEDLWNPKYKNQITVLDSLRDMMGMSLKTLGYSLNDQDADHIKAAYMKLKMLVPNIQAFANNAAQQVYINEDSRLGMMPSGNANMIVSEYPFFKFIYPKDGAIIWIDNMVIPRGAWHVENAYRFINFILRPEIAKRIATQVGYSTPNLAAIKLMSKAERANRILNPLPEDLKNAEVESYIDSQSMQLYLKYWEMLKLDV